MVTVYGEDCVSDKSLRKWSARFRAGRESLVDDPSPGQANTSRPISSTSVDNYSQQVALSDGDGVRAVDSEATDRPAQGSAYGHFNICFSIMKTPLSWSRSSQVMSWCHHYEPETKRDNMQWKHTSSPSPKKFKAVASAGKVFLDD
ncbi:hypothetical protein HNY73_012008 [Argiope bruennichi]|uniref:Mos1 transposase HTH domain-containing protein n=1 Tax=Argiope bruennichi TaxID=94029 RepID=A0A8T0EU65_ARGBR|nr:hypothetical protein HNY73_012008 [Argiope bruennichi]